MSSFGTYSADSPITDPQHDVFGRWPFAQRVARVIADRRDTSSIVIAVYGAWGEGKTTVLNFVERELAQHSHVVSLRFNPWRFTSEEMLLRGFFDQLASKLGRSLTTRREEIGEAIQKYGRPLASLVGKADAAEGVASLFAQADLEALRERIGTLLVEEGKRVVILVDDVDRLEKDEIHAVFRLVKLTADFVNTAYVLAFDDQMVAAALQERYGAFQPGAGRAFLEKIVQVPLNLPAADSIALRQLCYDGVNQALSDSGIELTEQQVRQFVQHFGAAFDGRLRTPRTAMLYANILSFSLPILKDEVHPVDLMLVEGLRVFYPALYGVIRDNPDLVLGEIMDFERNREKKNEATKQRISSAMEDLDDDTRASAVKLLTALFPQLNSVYGNVTYGAESEEQWAKAQRVASREYFARYFSYAILSGDVKDETIVSLLNAAETASVEDLSSEIQTLVTPRNAEKILQKLRRHEGNASPSASRNLALALSLLGALFPNPPSGIFSLFNPWTQAAICISSLVENLPTSEERVSAAGEIIRIAQPLGFAVECFRWFPVFDEERPNPKAFTTDQNDALGRLLSVRIAGELAGEEPLWITQADTAGPILWAWRTYGRTGETHEYIRGTLENDPGQVIKLLQVYLPTVHSGSGMSKGAFQRSQYDALVQDVDPAVVQASLQRHLGKPYEEALASEAHPGERDSALSLALQFGRLHAYLSGRAESEDQ